jgi:endogenous inhibitor of DNA gyrase (YacG/DUF329 family)
MFMGVTPLGRLIHWFAERRKRCSLCGEPATIHDAFAQFCSEECAVDMQERAAL